MSVVRLVHLGREGCFNGEQWEVFGFELLFGWYFGRELVEDGVAPRVEE